MDERQARSEEGPSGSPSDGRGAGRERGCAATGAGASDVQPGDTAAHHREEIQRLQPRDLLAVAADFTRCSDEDTSARRTSHGGDELGYHVEEQYGRRDRLAGRCYGRGGCG